MEQGEKIITSQEEGFQPQKNDSYYKEQNEKAISTILELRGQIEELLLYNLKMSTAVRMFTKVYFTKDEKIKIGMEIDKSYSETQLNEIYNKYESSARENTETATGNAVDLNFVFSERFLQDFVQTHYFQMIGGNPFDLIEKLLKPFEEREKIKEEIKNNSEPVVLKEWKRKWEQNEQVCKENLSKISTILNGGLNLKNEEDVKI